MGGGGSSVLVIAGIWMAILGYAVLYTGVAKINGDSTYHLAKAFAGTAPSMPAGTGGGPWGRPQAQPGWQQASMIPMVPVA